MSNAMTGQYLPATNAIGISKPQSTNTGATYWPNPSYPWHHQPWDYRPWVVPYPWAVPYVPSVIYQSPATVTVTFKPEESELAVVLKTLLEAVEKQVIDQETLVKILQLVKDK